MQSAEAELYFNSNWPVNKKKSTAMCVSGENKCVVVSTVAALLCGVSPAWPVPLWGIMLSR